MTQDEFPQKPAHIAGDILRHAPVNYIPLLITNDKGEEVLRITKEGTIIAPAATYDEATRRFVEFMEPILKKSVETIREEVGQVSSPVRAEPTDAMGCHNPFVCVCAREDRPRCSFWKPVRAEQGEAERLREENTRLRDLLKNAYELVPLGEPAQFVGVHTPQWGKAVEPTVAFREIDGEPSI